MKKLITAALCILLVGLCACGQIVSGERQTATSPKEETVITTTSTLSDVPISTLHENETNEDDPYTAELKSIIKVHDASPDQLKHIHYALYDIDVNGVKELLLGKDMHGGIGINYIFTMHNGVAVPQEEFLPPERDLENACLPLLFSNGVIGSNSQYHGELNYVYLRFEDGKLKFQTLLSDRLGSYFRMHEQFSTVAPITKEEFDRVRKEMEGDGQVVELDWMPLAEYGR